MSAEAPIEWKKCVRAINQYVDDCYVKRIGRHVDKEGDGSSEDEEPEEYSEEEEENEQEEEENNETPLKKRLRKSSRGDQRVR